MPDAYYKDRWFEVENAIIDAVATLHLLGFYLDTDGDAMDGVIACLASRSGHRLSDAYYLPATAAGEGGAA